MEFGIHLPNSGPFASAEGIVSMATAAEKLGYHAVHPHDHITWGDEDRYHFYAGSCEAADEVGGPHNFYDSMVTLSYLAGVTSRIKLIPSAMCLGWRPILLFARQILSLHQLSKGRFILNVCVGNVRNDFDVSGTPWEKRGPIAVEKLKVLRKLIDEPSPLSFEGEHVNFENAMLEPRPEGLRMWYAGTSDIAVKRAARFGTGWCPAGGTDYIASKIPDVLREAQRVGRGDVRFEFATEAFVCIAETDDKAWEIADRTISSHDNSEWMQRHDPSSRSRALLVGTPETVAEGVRRYEAAGLTHVNLCVVSHSLPGILEQMDMFASDVMPNVT